MKTFSDEPLPTSIEGNHFGPSHHLDDTAGAKPRALATILALFAGILVSVDYLSLMPSEALDSLRYLVTGALVLTASPSPQKFRSSRILLFSLLAMSLYALVSGLVTLAGDLSSHGVTGIASATLGYQLAKRRQIRSTFLCGVLLGSFLSSVDILLQWSNLPYLGKESVYGLSFSGFSFTRTAAAPLFAIALVLVIAPFLWSHRPGLSVQLIRSGVGVVVFAGLILTAGRGGMLGVVFALAAWGLHAFRRRPAQIALFGVAAFAVGFMLRETFLFQRLTSEEVSQAATRQDRNIAAFEAYLTAPILGPDPLAPTGLAISRAHMPLLYFAGEAGLLGMVATVISIAILIFAIIRGLRKWSGANSYGLLIGIVILTTSFLEPTGFFVGLGRVSLLFIAIDICLQEDPR